MDTVDPAIEYLAIVLRLRKIAPELVESYFGPSELSARIEAEQPDTSTPIQTTTRYAHGSHTVAPLDEFALTLTLASSRASRVDPCQLRRQVRPAIGLEVMGG